MPDFEKPTTSACVELEAIRTGTRMTRTSRFTSAEQMEQLASMGMVEGMTEALGQIEGILAEG